MIEVTDDTIHALVDAWSEYLNSPEGNAAPQVMSQWDVSRVTSFVALFQECRSKLLTYPGNDIGGWKFGPVPINMTSMFAACLYVPDSIAAWNVSSVTNMSSMFYNYLEDDSTMNVPLGKWDVSNVTDFSHMFSRCTAFNQPLGGWDVSNATDMTGMFAECRSFNQSLGRWNVSKVTHMSEMFSQCTAFNQPLRDWDVRGVKGMGYMFRGADSFNQSLASWHLHPMCEISQMLASVSFFNYTPIFPERKLRGNARYVFMNVATRETALVYRLYQQQLGPMVKVGDIMRGMIWSMEFKLLDHAAEIPGAMRANNLYDATAIDTVRQRVREFAGFV